MNILIYHAHETKQYAWSYDAMNRAKSNAVFEDFGVNPQIPDLDLGADFKAGRSSSPEMERGGRRRLGEGRCRCQNRRISGRGSRTVRLGGF